MDDFDPNKAADTDSGIFGLPFTEEESKLVLLPIPWEATISYRTGTSKVIESIIEASRYVELYSKEFGNFFNMGIAMVNKNSELEKRNRKARKYALSIISNRRKFSEQKLQTNVEKVDNLCNEMNGYVYKKTINYLDMDKVVGVIGGDHSVAFGSIKAHLEKKPDMAVLQIDAHCDLRNSFEDFKYSHASVMHNVLHETNLRKLIQVGIRSYCEEEYIAIEQSKGRIQTFFESDIAESKSNGEAWIDICTRIVEELPKEVYISFDIDGLVPCLCPNTGTPVPGGLTYQEAIILLQQIIESNKSIIGFDLVEVSHDNEKNSIDAIVGAHLLYQLSSLCIKSCNYHSP